VLGRGLLPAGRRAEEGLRAGARALGQRRQGRRSGPLSWPRGRKKEGGRRKKGKEKKEKRKKKEKGEKERGRKKREEEKKNRKKEEKEIGKNLEN
jgi:hypothetical protein